MTILSMMTDAQLIEHLKEALELSHAMHETWKSGKATHQRNVGRRTETQRLIAGWVDLELARRAALLDGEPVTNGQVAQMLTELNGITSDLRHYLNQPSDLAGVRQLTKILADRTAALGRPGRPITAARFHAVVLDVKLKVAALVPGTKLRKTLVNLPPRPKK